MTPATAPNCACGDPECRGPNEGWRLVVQSEGRRRADAWERYQRTQRTQRHKAIVVMACAIIAMAIVVVTL